jgi:hypothetical protein
MTLLGRQPLLTPSAHLGQIFALRVSIRFNDLISFAAEQYRHGTTRTDAPFARDFNVRFCKTIEQAPSLQKDDFMGRIHLTIVYSSRDTLM